MRTTALLPLVLSVALFGGCTKDAADESASAGATPASEQTATAGTTDEATATTTAEKTMAEKAYGAGLRAKNKAEELKAEAEEKGKEADAMNE